MRRRVPRPAGNASSDTAQLRVAQYLLCDPLLQQCAEIWFGQPRVFDDLFQQPSW